MVAVLRVIVSSTRFRAVVLEALDEAMGSSGYPVLSISETDAGFDVRSKSGDLASARDSLERAGGRVLPGGYSVLFEDKPSETAIVLLSTGKPVVAFSDTTAMRAWLHARGSMTGRLYTKMEVPLNPR